MTRKSTHTDTDSYRLERLDDLLAQTQALLIVADCDGLQGLREDLHHAYMQALLRSVMDARAVVGEITTEGGA